jgi:hypothetical protein
MATSISWPPIGGSGFSIPGAGEVGWPALSNFLIALASAQGTAAQKVGTRTATSSPVTVGSTDCVIRVALSVPGAVAVNLPTGVNGQYFVIVDGTGDAATNNITITPNGGETVNGGASYSLNQDNGAIALCFTGSGNWSIIGSFAASAGGATIARNSIATATADYVVINDGTGILSEEQYLSQVRGGFGENVSGFTGLVKAASGSFDASLLVNADVSASAAIDATKIGNGDVNNTLLSRISDLTGPAQAAIDAKLPLTGGTLSSALFLPSASPTTATEAAHKGYVDSVASGLKVRASVYVATTENITLSGPQTIDGESVVAGDRVLVKDQTTTADNGIYVVAAGAWGRATDANTWVKLVSAFCFIETGSSNGDSGWVCTVNSGGTLGTTPVTWTQFSDAGNYTVSDGLLLTGNVLTVKQNGSTTLDISGSGVKVKDNIALVTPSVTTSMNFAPVVDQSAPASGVTVWGTADGRIRKIGAGEASASYLGGGLVTELKATTFTAVAGFHYLCNTTLGGYTATLPTGSTGAVIRFSDDTRTWAVYNLTIAPASGQSIGNLLTNETLVCDLSGAFVQFAWDGTRWVVDTNGFAANISNGSLSSAQGMGAKNYISNPNNSTNWTSFNATNVAVSTETTVANLPAGYTQSGAIKILRAGGTTDYVYTRFTLDKSDYGKKFQLSFDQSFAGASTTDFTLAVYSNTGSTYAGTSTLLPLQTSTITALTGSFITTFDAPNATAPYIEVRVIAAAGVVPLYLNNVYCGPGVQVQGAAISDDQDWTSITTSGFGTPSSVLAKYRRVGSSLHVYGRFTTGTVSADPARIFLPNSWTVGDTGSGAPRQIVGSWWINSSTASSQKRGILGAVSADTFVSFSYDDFTAATTPYGTLTGTNIVGSTVVLGFSFVIPISQWSGSGTVNLGAGAQVEYAWNSDTSDAPTTSSGFSYGPSGVVFGSFSTSNRTKRVRFQYPIQATDEIVLELFDNSGNQWIPAASSLGISTSTTTGIVLQTVNTTDVDVIFGSAGFGNTVRFAAGAWSGIAGFWKWRVKKINPSSPVGFGLATHTDSGLSYKNRFQRKVLTTNLTSNGAISEWAFSNLTIGKVYRLDITARMVHTSSVDNQKQGIVTVTHSGTTLYGPSWDVTPMQTADQFMQATSTFVATATTITMSWSAVNMQLWAPSYASLTELNDTENVSAF